MAKPASALETRPDSPELADACGAGFGVYVHIPFCSHKCGYCDFASWAGIDQLQDRYVDALCAEIEAKAPPPADTVFVGGGTPSRLRAGLLARILRAIPRSGDAEVTIEANPESASPSFFEEAAGAGATRVSLGMQSSAQHVLRFLEREHRPDAVGPAVLGARAAGIGRVNLDVIFGTPGEAAEDWRRTLSEALILEPDHVSAYALTIEAATPLGRRVRRGEAPAPDDDDCADKYEWAQAALAEAGLIHYEISNWARPGHACRHNLLYWGAGPYVGFGCSAHGHEAGRRRRAWNVASPERYCEALEAGRPAEAGHEVLSVAEAQEERLQLGLRRVAGVPESWLESRDLGPAELLVQRSDGRARIRPDALFRAHQVLAYL